MDNVLINVLFFWMIGPKYLDFSIVDTATLPSLNQHFKYSVFDLLNLKLLVFKVYLHLSNLLLTPLPSLINKIYAISK